jgi:predicted Zn-dependent peptidase
MYVIGFDKKQEELAKKILLEILEEIKKKTITTEEIKGIKNQYLSHLIDDMQKPEYHALELLHKELYKPYYDYEEKEKHIKKISKENIMNTAKEIFSDKITISLLKS